MCDLTKFKRAHQQDYETALKEIRNGKKLSHWMWYIFPQLKGLGKSGMSNYYGIQSLDEAKAFLQDEYLGGHLLEILNALLQLDCDDARMIMGRPDDMKLKSCMTLFAVAAPDESIFIDVLKKFFDGKMGYRTLKMLGIKTESSSSEQKAEANNDPNCNLKKDDNNISKLRLRYPNGLHFIVGDIHGEYTTLQCLMEKIKFDPRKDFIYFVGDYNSGGDPSTLLRYMAQYFQEDYNTPGFHMIRGNHERELWPIYELRNLPDILVINGRNMNYYLAHAGMVQNAFDLINEDIKGSLELNVHAYALDESLTCHDAPFRQITWSRKGLYSQHSRYHVWPSEESLRAEKACIIHGHTPFSQLKRGNYYSYGDKMLLWEKQRIWFAEDLQSFDIDSNVKGRRSSDDSYRGLSCICLEIVDEIAAKNNGFLTREAIQNYENFVFSVPYTQNVFMNINADLSRVIEARPQMKRIKLNENGEPQIIEQL